MSAIAFETFSRGVRSLSADIDSNVAVWFREHLTPSFSDLLFVITSAGSEIWISFIAVTALVCLLWKRHWYGVSMLLLMLPCGTLLGQLIKHIVRRERPFIGGPWGEWGGYSFPSGHTLGATLLYGCLLLLLLPAIRDRRWRMFATLSCAVIVFGVAFSRVALGAHYVTDVACGFLFGVTWSAVSVGVVEIVRRGAWRRLLPAVAPAVQPVALENPKN